MTLTEFFRYREEKLDQTAKEFAKEFFSGVRRWERLKARIEMSEDAAAQARHEIIKEAIRRHKTVIGHMPPNLTPNTEERFNQLKDEDRVLMKRVWYNDEGEPIEERSLIATVVLSPGHFMRTPRIFAFDEEQDDCGELTFEFILIHGFLQGHSIIYIDDGR